MSELIDRVRRRKTNSESRALLPLFSERDRLTARLEELREMQAEPQAIARLEGFLKQVQAAIERIHTN